MLGMLGFAASINLLNVDAFIVRANAERLRLSEELDIAYLASLSSDAVLPLLNEIEGSGLGGDPDYQSQLLAALACHAFGQNEYAAPQHWQSFNLSQADARRAWTEFKNSDAFERIEMPTEYDERGLIMRVDQQEFNCAFFGYWD